MGLVHRTLALDSSIFNDPEPFFNTFQSAGIDEKLETLRSLEALASEQGPNDYLAEYMIHALVGYESPPSRVEIAQKYLLNNIDFELRESGVNYLIYGMMAGMDAASSDSAKDALILLLENLDRTGLEGYIHGSKLSSALVMMGSEVGLDAYLTKTETIRNFSRKDRWNPDSPPEVFQALSQQYQKDFAQSKEDGQAIEWMFFWSKFYQLAEARRKQGKRIVVYAPLINLDSVLEGTYEPRSAEEMEIVLSALRSNIQAEEPDDIPPAAYDMAEKATSRKAATGAPARVVTLEPSKEPARSWLWFAGVALLFALAMSLLRRK